jgi:hypothetical protein
MPHLTLKLGQIAVTPNKRIVACPTIFYFAWFTRVEIQSFLISPCAEKATIEQKLVLMYD